MDDLTSVHFIPATGAVESLCATTHRSLLCRKCADLARMVAEHMCMQIYEQKQAKTPMVQACEFRRGDTIALLEGQYKVLVLDAYLEVSLLHPSTHSNITDYQQPL